MDRPPCWPEGQPCPNACAARLHQQTVYNHVTLNGPWTGWRLAGARLISPHRDWIAPHVLDRWMYQHGRLFTLSGEKQYASHRT
ncbi:hypothetical protein J2X06_002947 [Lysobacter niastensis]|uniref:Uncharacterized protein n=1 Tax=Lysobacter niastensis TaxID=380629 RepID=A0ABU1WEA6_9GAMM|nr:hypothetical protein [Lysobacter niastensis]